MSRSGGYKCYNIHCNSCIGKTLCGEPEDKALGCDSRIVKNKSNGERIRAMSDEEMKKFFGEISETAGCPPENLMDCIDNCETCWGIYLRQPAEENEA